MGTHPIFESDFDGLTDCESSARACAMSGRPPPNIDGMVSLKIDNLSYRTDLETLRRKFGKYGEIGDVYVPKDKYGESRGFAFVRFYDKRDAEDAIDAMDGKELDGRDLRVDIARHDRPQPSRRRYRSRSRSRSRRRYSRSRSRDRYGSRRRYSRSPRRRSSSRDRRRDRRSRTRSPPSRRGSPSRSRSRSASRSRSKS